MKADINLKVGYTIDKNGLNDLKRQLIDIQWQAAHAKTTGTLTQDLKDAGEAASKLEDILNSSWNNKLGQLDLNKVNNGIKTAYGNVQKLKEELSKSGNLGASAYNNFALSVLNTNVQIKQTSKLLDSMATTLKNTIRYGISSSIFNNFTNSIEKAYNYTTQLDSSLNDIRIVTGKSADEMETFAIKANKVAKELGKSTRDYTEASLIYYQQGLSDEEAQKRAEVTLKAANVTGQNADEVSEQLTAVWNGYKVITEEAELYVDKLAAVAATTASDLEELSTGMSKVASAANLMGVDIDQLNAQLATIVSVTRQAPESVGTALKTIYARMGDIEAGIDTETDLGTYTAEMAEMGINVLDTNGKLRDMGDVIEEIGNKWTTMSREQQISLSQTMAGTRQYNNLLSLFDNWDMYTEALETSANAAGTLQEQQDIYMESTAAHLKQLKTEAERTYDILFDQNIVNGFADSIAGLLGIFNNLLEGLGGGARDFIFLGSVASNVLNKQIGQSIERQIENIEALKTNLSREELQKEVINLNSLEGKNIFNDKAVEKEIPYVQKLIDLQKYLTEEESKSYTESIAKIGELEQKIQDVLKYKDIAKKYLGDSIDVDKITSDDFDDLLKAEEKKYSKEYKKFEDLKEMFDSYDRQIGEGHYAAEKDLTDDLIKNIKEATNSLEDQESIKELINKITKSEIIEEKEKLLILSAQKEKRDEISKSIKEIKKGYSGAVDAESNTLSDLVYEQQTLQSSLDTDVKLKEREALISDSVKGLSSIVSLLTSLSGLISTISNEDLSGWEKFQQIIAVFVANLPIIILNFSTIKQLIPNLISLFTNMSTAEFIAQQGANSLAGALWKIIAPFAPLIIAIGALTVGIYALVKSSQQGQKEIDDLRKASENLAKQAEETKSNIESINQSFDEYKNLLSALNSCTKGTEEWNEALNEVNLSALEILDKYPELANIPNLFTRINGALTLNEDVLDSYIEKQQNYANIIKSAGLLSNAIADEKQSDRNTKKLFNSIKSDLLEIDSPYNKPQGLNIGEDERNKVIETLTSNINQLGDLTEKEYKNKLYELNINDKYINTLISYQDRIDELIDETNSASTKMKNIAETIAAIKIGDAGASTNTQTAIFSEEYANKATERQRELYETYTGSGISKISGGNNKIYLEMLSQLQEIEGFENFRSNSNGVRGTDSNRTFVFNTDNGEVSYSASEIASIIAEYQITKELNDINYSEAAENILSKVQESLSVDKQTADEIIQALRNKDYNSLNEETINTIKNSNFEDKTILTDEEAKSIGLESGQSIIDGLNTAIEQWDPEEAKKQTEEKIKSLYSLAAEAAGESEDTIKALVSEMKKLQKYSDTSEEDLIDLAKKTIIFNNNLQELADSFSDNKDVLKDWQKSTKGITVEQAKAVGDLKEKFDNLFDTDASIDFLKENLEDIEAILNGDTDALNRLEQKLGKQYVLDIDDGRLREAFAQAENAFNQLSNTDLVIGASFEDEQALADIQRFFNSAKLSSEEAQAVLNKFGYEGELEEVKAPDQTRTLYDQETTIDYTPVKSYPPTMPVWDGNGYKMESLPPITSYAPRYSTKLVPHTETIPGDSYWVLKSKDGSASSSSGGKTTGLSSSVKSLGTGSSRKSSVSSFSGYKPSSGGGSSNKPNKIDPIESEIDRYHDVDVQLSLISNDLNELDKQKEKLFGKDLIKNLNEQLQLLNKQIDVTNQKIKIAQNETQELKDKLSNSGVQFNADGTISNYSQIYESQLNYVNSIISKYNSMSASAQENYEDTVEKAKEDFENFVENIDRYDELITDTIPGLEENIQDAINERIDIQIEKFDMEIEIRLNMAEAERDWNEFKKKIIDGIEDDDILGNVMAKLVDFSSYYKENDKGIVQALETQINNTLKELDKIDKTGKSDIYGDNRTAALDDLKKYYDELTSNLTNVLELQKEIHESYLDMMDEAQDKFDEQIDTYETINDLIEHDMEVISLIYGEESYSKLDEYYNKQQKNFNSQLDFQSQQVNFWKQQLDTLDKGTDEWDNAKEKWMSAVSEWNQLVENSIQNLQDKYLNSINLIFQNLNNKVTNGLGLNYIEEEWNLINKNSDEYLDTVNSIYSVQSLESKYLDAIDNTDNLSSQKKIKEVMDAQLKQLKEKDKLTQYDVDRANKIYEITLKQIALEEAQQNKTSMRLRRDSQGNYRYEYVADNDEVSKLEEELQNLYNSLYNFDKDAYNNNLNQAYDIWVEFQEKMAQAAQINDPEERAKMEALYKEQYGELINNLVAENENIRLNLENSAFIDLAAMYVQNANDFSTMTDMNTEAFENMTSMSDQMFQDFLTNSLDGFKSMAEEEKNEIFNNLVPSWNSGIQSMINVITGEGGFYEVYKNSFNEISNATKEYEDGLKELQNNAQISFEEIGKGIDNTINETEELVNNNKELISSYEDSLDAVEDVINQLDRLVNKYKEAEEAAKNAAKEAYNYWSQQQEQAAQAANEDLTSQGNSNNINNNNNLSNTNNNSTSNQQSIGSGNNIPEVGDTVTYTGGYYYSSSYGTGIVGARGIGKKVRITRIIPGRPYPIHVVSNDSAYGWLKEEQLSGFDTGGYTGEWDNKSGKLAVLHQKELVLNEEDTKNMLNAVNILRNITNNLGKTFLDKLSSFNANNNYILSNMNPNNNTLEQRVSIEATFPNVKNSYEIENALNNLVNVAAQRIKR